MYIKNEEKIVINTAKKKKTRRIMSTNERLETTKKNEIHLDFESNISLFARVAFQIYRAIYDTVGIKRAQKPGAQETKYIYIYVWL